MSSTDENWEEFDTPRKMFGVFNVEEPYSATIRASFTSKDEAEKWIEWAKSDYVARPDDSDHNMADHYQALPIRVSGSFFNSYEYDEETVWG